MSTQRFEGPDIAALLTEMTEKFGPAATVVAANRCRSGGVAGFFARETFEIYVDVPAPLATANGRPRRRSERGSETALEQLIAAADRHDGAASAPTSRTGPFDDFNAAYDRIATPAAAGRQDATRSRVRPPKASAAKAGTPKPSRRVARQNKAQARADAKSVARQTRGRRGQFSRGGNAVRNEEERIIDLSSIELSSLLPTFAPSPAESTTNAEFGPIALSGVVPGGVRVEALAALGIPALWLKRYPSGYAAIHDVLTNVIPPPPLATAAGGIIVFIGEKQSALRTARSVARALKQDPDECVLLSPSERPADHAGEHIMVIDELSARREQWANLDRTTIVAIDASFDRQDISWGRHVISVLRPILRWGVVDSTRKAEDIRWWARGLGGLHALAVTGVTSTATPAAVLQCGVPVARLDGQVATPAMWQKLLEQRLSDAVNRRAPDLITA